MKLIVFISFLCMFNTQEEIVKVSYYGKKFHGKTTASGKPFNMYGFTTAHKNLTFGTMVEITNISNNKSIVVEVNDRGPYIKGRTFDLSKAAFDSIGDIEDGILKVKYKIIK